MVGRPRGLNGASVIFLVLAALWSVAEFLGSFYEPVVVRPRPDSVRQPTRTLFSAFGPSEVIVTALGLGVIALVGLLLYRRGRNGTPGAGRAAWGLSLATAALGVLGFAYLFGVAICLLLSCGAASRAPQSSVDGSDPSVLTGTRAP